MQAASSALTAILLFLVSVFTQGLAMNPQKPEPTTPVSDTLTIFSRNEEFSQHVGNYAPDGVKLDFISEYVLQDEMEDVVKNGWQGRNVDIFIVDSDELCKYFDTALPLNKIGITDKETSGLFSFNVESGKNAAGELCALPVVNAPGVFLYKRSAAKKLFGTDDPDVVQSHISDWKKFLETATLAKSKGITMTTNTAEMYYAFSCGGFTDKNGKLTIPAEAMDWLSTAKTMTDSGYAGSVYSWSYEWTDGFTDPNIFGHFAANWLVEGLLPIYTDSEDYAVCAGPQRYVWGGSYAFVSPECGNYEAAAELLRKVCINGYVDTSAMTTAVIPANRSKFVEMQPIICSSTGKQNLGGIYLDVLDNVQPLSQKNALDYALSVGFQSYMTWYLRGELGDFTITEAVDYYCEQMKQLYPDCA